MSAATLQVLSAQEQTIVYGKKVLHGTAPDRVNGQPCVVLATEQGRDLHSHGEYFPGALDASCIDIPILMPRTKEPHGAREWKNS